jgi:integrase
MRALNELLGKCDYALGKLRTVFLCHDCHSLCCDCFRFVPSSCFGFLQGSKTLLPVVFDLLAAKTQKAKEIDAPPGILTVQQTARLLEAASPELLPYIAIGAFGGLRRAELERLDWSEIDFESGLIEVTAKKSKTARRRFVRIQPNLREWLLPVRKHKGNVTPGEATFEKLFDEARTAAGIDEWPDNALRHSFASYHLAHFKDAAALALEMGHVNSGMIFNHYRELVRPKEAERYWNIRPAATAKIVPIAAR